MNDLALVKSARFGDFAVDLWKNPQDEFYMSGEQIGRALGYADPVKAISTLFDRNRDRLEPHSVVLILRATDGKQYHTRVFDERGVYEIIRKSSQPRADAFYDWVYDVLHEIRTTGHYTPRELSRLELIDMARDAEIARIQAEAEKAALSQQLAAQQPKVALYDVAMTAENAMAIGTAAKLLNIGPNKLFAWLREQGLLMTQGSRYNLPRQTYIDQGLFTVREYTITHTSHIENKTQTLVTQKGLAYIHERWQAAHQTGLEVAK